MNRIKIYLLDDHPIILDCFKRAIADEPDLEVVGQAGTASVALRETLATKPDVVLVDLNLPDRDGIEVLESLRAQLPAAKLLVVSGYDDAFRVTEALRAGAQGYLVKTVPLAEVLEGIRRVAAGGAPLSAGIASAVVTAMRKPTSEGTHGIDVLSLRERQVLRLLASGMSTREAGARLTISSKTIETHRIRIYRKLGCKTTIDLARVAVRVGLIKA